MNSTPPHVAMEMGLSPSTVYNWKKGHLPNSAIVVMIAKHFNVTADYLLGLSEYPQCITSSASIADILEAISDELIVRDDTQDNYAKLYFDAFKSLPLKDKRRVKAYINRLKISSED